MFTFMKNFFAPKAETQKSYSYQDVNSYFLQEQDKRQNAYATNPIVHRCVNIIAQAGSHVPWIVLHKKTKLKEHSLYRLLHMPNPSTAGADFFACVISNMLLYGNAYILALGKHAITQMHLLHSPHVDVQLTEGGVAVCYRHSVNGKQYQYHIDPKTRHSQVLHIKNYHPSDSLYGLSSLQAAESAINLHNQSTRWNTALLNNGARPTGALVLKNGHLNDEQFSRLQQQLYERFSGTRNTGQPIILEGGLDWKEMSVNPKDMDFIRAKENAAKEIALAFGVPVQLLGIQGDSTYNNMQEARLALWEETILPLLDKISDSLTLWLSNWYGQDITVDFDRDAISALTEKRQSMWKKISEADFMTLNEKRALVNLPPISAKTQEVV